MGVYIYAYINNIYPSPHIYIYTYIHIYRERERHMYTTIVRTYNCDYFFLLSSSRQRGMGTVLGMMRERPDMYL